MTHIISVTGIHFFCKTITNSTSKVFDKYIEQSTTSLTNFSFLFPEFLLPPPPPCRVRALLTQREPPGVPLREPLKEPPKGVPTSPPPAPLPAPLSAPLRARPRRPGSCRCWGRGGGSDHPGWRHPWSQPSRPLFPLSSTLLRTIHRMYTGSWSSFTPTRRL